MASIKQLIVSTRESLRNADGIQNVRSENAQTVAWLITACARLLQIAESQEERDQKVATALDELAEKIGYLSSTPHEVRAQIREVVRIIRGENEKGA